VCIVNWNCRDMLHACLHSLRQERDVDLEIIVVDNASSDGAPDMVAREFPQVRLIRNSTNAGFARANNQAAAVSRGDFLFFLNNDTVVPPGALVKLQAFLEDHPEVALVGPRLRNGNGKVQTSYRKRPTIATFLHRTWLLRWTCLFRGNYESYRRMTLDETQPQCVDILMGAALMARREPFLRMGGWDDGFRFGGEDMELCRRAGKQGHVVYLPQVEITHFGRASTKRNIGFASTQIAIGFVQYFRKSGASRAALLGYKLAVTLDAPIRIVGRGLQFLVRRLTGNKRQATQSWTELRGLVPFLFRGLLSFWRA
jgi:N-acetylglucosaminyl-diphospho-decaprenol L-rhamnosyltransferase